ncbi:MAG TPA: hypothetical protein DCS09_06630 [Porphyromonadaceae bacterium]|nr:hypothetical protein [Porphyromonadaceae bacterium]
MTDFDQNRKGTGTKEWAEVTENIQIGCANGCLYCYAAHNSNRFGKRARKDWCREELTKRAAILSYPAKDGVIMFPSTHDITPFNLDSYVRVAKLMLEKGNRLLIVSKPRPECIDRLIWDFEQYREQILFRFTIGTIDQGVSVFWEPSAPLPSERIIALRVAYHSGFATSVSIEPMLSGRFGAADVVSAVLPYVTETIWIGKMNKALLRVDKAHDEAVRNVLEVQCDGEILKLVDDLKAYRQIRWKDSIKEVVARHTVTDNEGGVKCMTKSKWQPA